MKLLASGVSLSSASSQMIKSVLSFEKQKFLMAEKSLTQLFWYSKQFNNFYVQEAIPQEISQS
jgi:hypothetical protein